MHSNETAQSLEEVSRLGREAYERSVRPLLRSEDMGEFGAVDVDSGNYEVDSDDFTATERLMQRRPNARIWLARAGERAAYRFGGPLSPLQTAFAKDVQRQINEY